MVKAKLLEAQPIHVSLCATGKSLETGPNMHTHQVFVRDDTSHVGGAVGETVKGRTGNLTSSSKGTQPTEIRIA